MPAETISRNTVLSSKQDIKDNTKRIYKYLLNNRKQEINFNGNLWEDKKVYTLKMYKNIDKIYKRARY